VLFLSGAVLYLGTRGRYGVKFSPRGLSPLFGFFTPLPFRSRREIVALAGSPADTPFGGALTREGVPFLARYPPPPRGSSFIRFSCDGVL